MTEVHIKRLALGLQMTGSRIIKRQAGIKGHDTASRTQKLLAGVFFRMRFAGDFAVQHTNLIGAYNQMSGVTYGQRLCFLFRETGHQMTR